MKKFRLYVNVIINHRFLKGWAAALLLLGVAGIMTSFGQTRLTSADLIGTTTSWGSNAPIDLTVAYDGDYNTFIDTWDNWGFVGYDFGTNGAMVETFKYAPRVGYAGRMNGAVLRGSNSSNFLNDFDTLYIISSDPAENELTEAAVGSSATYRYIYLFLGAGTYANVSELELYDAGAAELTGTIIGQEEGSQWCAECTPDKAFDGDFNTYVEGPTTIGFVGYDFGEGNEVALTSWKYAPRSTWEGRLVGSELRGSNSLNFLSEYTVLSTITTQPTAGELTEAVVADVNSYRYVYWKGGVNSYGDIAELELWYNPVSPDATLSDLAIDGSTISGFDPNVEEYVVGLAEGASIPTVTATENHDNATSVVTQAGALYDTATVVVTAEDGISTKTYNVIFWDTLFTGTIIGHEGSWGDDPSHYIAAAFDGDLTTFVDAPTAVGYVGLDLGLGKKGKLTGIRYAPRSDLPARMVNGAIMGANEEDYSDADTLYTIAETPVVLKLTNDTVVLTESYRFIYYKSPADGYCNIAELALYGITSTIGTDATLTDLQVDGTTVDNFDPETYSYDVEIAAGTTDVPVVTATTTDANATAVITDAEGLPGSTTVDVTAEDGTTKQTYTINFTVSSTGVQDFEADMITVYPTSSNRYFTVVTGRNANVIIVYDTNGKVVLRQFAKSSEEIIEIADPGIYFIQVMGKGVSKSFKVIKTN